jgi:hypothetical protein
METATQGRNDMEMLGYLSIIGVAIAIGIGIEESFSIDPSPC